MFAVKAGSATIALAVWAILASAPHQAQAQLSRSDVAASVPLTSIVDIHNQLWIEINTRWFAVPQSPDRVQARKDFVQFLRDDVLEQLHREGVTLYPVFDSLTAGGYATVAALFDRESIENLTNQMAGATQDAAVFADRGFALSIVLRNYFRKTEQLVVPTIEAQLTPSALQTLIARLDSPNN